MLKIRLSHDRLIFYMGILIPVASFTKEVNWRLAKRPLRTNGRLADLQLTSLVKRPPENTVFILRLSGDFPVMDILRYSGPHVVIKYSNVVHI